MHFFLISVCMPLSERHLATPKNSLLCSECAKIQADKKLLYALSGWKSSAALLSALLWQCVWVQGVFVLAVIGSESVCLHRRLLIIRRTDSFFFFSFLFGNNFIPRLMGKSNQINKEAARWLMALIPFPLLSFPSPAQTLSYETLLCRVKTKCSNK